MRRVLLASINAGGGHNALRDSFHAVLRQADPGQARFRPEVWDSSDRFVNSFYTFCVHHLTRFQGTVHELSRQRWAVELATRLSPQLLGETQRRLRQEPLDAVVSTHPLLSMMFVKAKHALGLPLPIITAIPDYGVPTSAFNPPQPHLRADYLLVMARDTYQHYVQRERVPDGRVHLSGFLTREPFQQAGHRRKLPLAQRRLERAAILSELRERHPQLAAIRPELPTVLFTGGSAWTEKTLPVLELLLANEPLLRQLNVLVVCGRDARFQGQLAERLPPESPVALFGFVRPEDYALLMGLADVPVLGSLAPASMQELLETGCGPLLLFHYIPGTERPHVAHIAAERIGVYEPEPEAMLELVAQAAGLCAASPRLGALRQEFPARAREIRKASVERALRLPAFLEQALEGGEQGLRSQVA